jgi:tetratricopeptide (TPR) repeat protein
MRRLLSLTVVAVLAACASAEKLGDRAAAVGDWKAAERQYADALQKDPANPEKKAKYEQARSSALQGAIAAARACRVSNDWECVYAESDYAIRLDAGNGELAAMRADAARNVGLLRLRGAQDASARGDHENAFAAFERARAVTNDPGVQAEAKRVSAVLVRGAVDEAQRRRAAQQYAGAVELLTLAANVDPKVRPTLDQARAEYDRWLDAQYEKEAQAGDALLRDRHFAEAQARYEGAQRYKKGGRAEPLARYARALDQGAQAVQRRDWPRATAAYDEAVRTGMDQTQLAATELDKVRIRPYAIWVRSVLVKPLRPDGEPWAGGRSRELDRLVGRLAEAALDGGGRRAAFDLYEALPRENKPDLYVSLVLPDGREFVTQPQKALRARLESVVVVNTNSYDARPVALRVFHADRPAPLQIGAVSFWLMDAVAGELHLADRSVVEVRVVAEPSQNRDGYVEGFAPLAAAVPASAPGPTPPRR